MSIISSFMSWLEDDDDDDDDENETEETSVGQPKSALSGDLHTGMTLEVSSEDGASILTGKIRTLEDESMTLERLPGGLAFPICSQNAAVRAMGLDPKMIPVRLRANVQESTRTLFRLKDIRIETHSESRDTFRLPLKVPVSLYRVDDEKFKNPEECLLLDISAGGACVLSEYVHVEDEILRIRVQLDDYSPLTYLGQIVRCTEADDGKFKYGILFAQLSAGESTNLNRILFNLQMGIKRTHMRTEEGHW